MEAQKSQQWLRIIHTKCFFKLNIQIVRGCRNTYVFEDVAFMVGEEADLRAKNQKNPFLFSAHALLNQLNLSYFWKLSFQEESSIEYVQPTRTWTEFDKTL